MKKEEEMKRTGSRSQMIVISETLRSIIEFQCWYTQSIVCFNISNISLYASVKIMCLYDRIFFKKTIFREKMRRVRTFSCKVILLTRSLPPSSGLIPIAMTIVDTNNTDFIFTFDFFVRSRKILQNFKYCSFFDKLRFVSNEEIEGEF